MLNVTKTKDGGVGWSLEGGTDGRRERRRRRRRRGVCRSRCFLPDFGKVFSIERRSGGALNHPPGCTYFLPGMKFCCCFDIVRSPHVPLSLSLFPRLPSSSSFSCHLLKSGTCIVFVAVISALSVGELLNWRPRNEPVAALAGCGAVGRCRNLKAISQRQFRPSNSRDVGKNERERRLGRGPKLGG